MGASSWLPPSFKSNWDDVITSLQSFHPTPTHPRHAPSTGPTPACFVCVLMNEASNQLRSHFSEPTAGAAPVSQESEWVAGELKQLCPTHLPAWIQLHSHLRGSRAAGEALPSRLHGREGEQPWRGTQNVVHAALLPWIMWPVDPPPCLSNLCSKMEPLI